MRTTDRTEKGLLEATASSTDSILFLTAVLVWGSTWYAITFQLGEVAASWSIAWRFAIAAALLLVFCGLRARRLTFGWREHFGMALQGFFLFSANYYVLYLAIGAIASGLVAVVFSTIQLMNVAFAAILFGHPIRPRVLAGGAFGIVGLALLFRPELGAFSFTGPAALGLALSLLGTASASLGNMAALANQRRGLPVVQSNAYGMAYGAALTALAAGIHHLVFGGPPPAFEYSVAYAGSLAYLALFGSIVGFGAYLTLMGRIGPDRAAYAMVVFPVVALGISTLLESYTWTREAIGGLTLVIMGNLLIMLREGRSREARPRG